MSEGQEFYLLLPLNSMEYVTYTTLSSINSLGWLTQTQDVHAAKAFLFKPMRNHAHKGKIQLLENDLHNRADFKIYSSSLNHRSQLY